MKINYLESFNLINLRVNSYKQTYTHKRTHTHVYIYIDAKTDKIKFK